MGGQETIADIAAEKRRIAKEVRDCASNGDYWDKKKANETAEDLEEEADRLDAAHKREIDEIKKQVAGLQQQLPKPDPNWRDICAKCFENGATEPPDCKYYTEDGCMSPIPDQHPLIQVDDAAKLREALVSVKKSIDDMGAASLDGDPEVLLMSLTQVCARLSARIEAALAEPPRNCDVIPAEEMRKIFQEELPVQLKNATEHEKKIIQLTADGIFDTVFAPYQPQKESEAAK